jgi:hypothetical protein
LFVCFFFFFFLVLGNDRSRMSVGSERVREEGLLK